MKKVLLTGGTGYLGSHLMPLLLGGFEVHIIGRRDFSMEGVHYWKIGEKSATEIVRFVDPHIIIHAATLYSRGGNSSSDIAKANLVFPLECIDAQNPALETFVNIDTPLEPSINDYAFFKNVFREKGRALLKEKFVNVLVHNMFGPGDAKNKFSSFIVDQCIRNVPQVDLTQGDNRRDFVFIEDVVSAVKMIVEGIVEGRTDCKEFEIGSGKSLSIREFAQRVKELSGSSSELGFGKISSRPGEIGELVANISKLEKLGWQPRFSVEQGIRKTIEADREALSHTTADKP